MTVLYDNIETNMHLILDLPFREGVGVVTRDVSKYHREMTLVHTPAWTTIAATGKPVLDFDGIAAGSGGAEEYFECAGASTTELNFTSGDYSIGGWVNYSGGDNSMILARYELDVSGWELYFYTPFLQLRHNHAAGATARTGVYSSPWAVNTWYFFGVSRSSATATMCQGTGGRSGTLTALTVTGDTLIDPETCTEDLVSCRFTKDGDWFNGPRGRLIVADVAFSFDDWNSIYEREKRWYP